MSKAGSASQSYPVLKCIQLYFMEHTPLEVDYPIRARASASCRTYSCILCPRPTFSYFGHEEDHLFRRLSVFGFPSPQCQTLSTNAGTAVTWVHHTWDHVWTCGSGLWGPSVSQVQYGTQTCNSEGEYMHFCVANSQGSPFRSCFWLNKWSLHCNPTTLCCTSWITDPPLECQWHQSCWC